ncbi:sensor histidine kinase [Mesoflavibacter sp.]|uniref:sensor histidine kinase n=1 Tax=Mesoflavibacter sp. TaxID=1930902 RepID=UPI003511CE7B
MQIKSKLLILGAILALIALTTMQGYLTFNTFDLRKKSFAVESRTKIGSIVKTPYVDSLSWQFRNDFLDKIPDYKLGLISKNQLLEDLQKSANSKNKQFLKYYTEGAKQLDLNENVLFKKVASTILLIDQNGNVEPLLEEGKDKSRFLIGHDFPLEEGLIINAWNWTFDKQYVDNLGETKSVTVKYKSSIFMKIVDWDKIIFNQLLFLFFISFLLFVFLISLVTYSIRNLLKLKRISDIKTDFINNITHELKTPLATLSIATKTLTNKFAVDNKDISKESIDTINRQNKRLQNLIDQVVDNSLGYHQIKLNKKPINLTSFLHEVSEDYMLTLPKNILFLREIEHNQTILEIDTFYISTAITNILNNAIKFEGTILKIKYHIHNNNHIISITDNGIGISQKNKKLIFDKFFRVSERNKHTYKGLGLGLYYCNQIVKAHDGTIDVESKLKEGTTFYIKLPVSDAKKDFISR